MRHDDLRRTVHKFFKDRLALMLDSLGADGPMSEVNRAPLHTSQMLAEGPLDSFRALALPEGEALFLARFCGSAGLPQSEAEIRPDRLLSEIQAAWRDMLREFEKHHAGLSHYDFSSTVLPARTAEPAPVVVTPGISLAETVAEYIAENRLADSWEYGTFGKKQAALDVLIELLSADIPIAAINKQHARDVKQVVAKLPPNRNKQQATRNLTIREAAALPGVAPIATVTVNAYISIYQSFFDWAAKNGHTEANPFEGMRVSAGRKDAQEKRQAFKPDALQAVYAELTHNTRGLVKKQSHKWATLIGMFSGARLNEICQLEVEDLKEQDGIWYFNLFDSDDDASNKKFKTAAARRKVPVHSRLLELGLLDYHRDMADRTTSRMFPDYSFEPKAGYGRSLSRWFNDVLTPALGIKTKAHVFHGLRHTVVTRLLQAGVEETVCQSIVGHERKGVTQGTYNREGYTLLQLQQAINKFPAQ